MVDSHDGDDLTVSNARWIDALIRAQARPAYAFALALTGRPDIAEEFVAGSVCAGVAVGENPSRGRALSGALNAL